MSAYATISGTFVFGLFEIFQFITFVKLHAGRNPLSSHESLQRLLRAFRHGSVERKLKSLSSLCSLSLTSVLLAALEYVQFSNLVDIVSSILSIIAMTIALGRYDLGGTPGDSAAVAMSAATFIAWLRMFDEIRGESHLGFYTHLLEQIFVDLTSFIIIVIGFLVAFSLAMMPLANDVFEDDGHDDEAEHPFRFITTAIYRSWLMAMGDFDQQEFAATKGWSLHNWGTVAGDGEEKPVMAHLLLLAFLVLVPLVMMNLIIAILSETFDRVMEQHVRVLIRQRMLITMHAETIVDIWCFGCCRTCKRPGPDDTPHPSRECCYDAGEIFYPSTLVVLRPEGHDLSDGEDAGAVRLQKLHSLVETKVGCSCRFCSLVWCVVRNFRAHLFPSSFLFRQLIERRIGWRSKFVISWIICTRSLRTCIARGRGAGPHPRKRRGSKKGLAAAARRTRTIAAARRSATSRAIARRGATQRSRR